MRVLLILHARTWNSHALLNPKTIHQYITPQRVKSVDSASRSRHFRTPVNRVDRFIGVVLCDNAQRGEGNDDSGYPNPSLTFKTIKN